MADVQALYTHQLVVSSPLCTPSNDVSNPETCRETTQYVLAGTDTSSEEVVREVIFAAGH